MYSHRAKKQPAFIPHRQKRPCLHYPPYRKTACLHCSPHKRQPCPHSPSYRKTTLPPFPTISKNGPILKIEPFFCDCLFDAVASRLKAGLPRLAAASSGRPSSLAEKFRIDRLGLERNSYYRGGGYLQSVCQQKWRYANGGGA